MEQLHLPDNIKVHFAGAESASYLAPVLANGVQYVLYTAFPFVYKRIFNKAKGLAYGFRSWERIDMELPISLNNTMRHVIQDSGLFSFLFGSAKDDVSESDVFTWYDGYVDYTLEHAQPVTVVEVDAQKIIGVEETWKLRERIKNDLPNNRIINVFHLEDGLYGLDRMIEFSDYIAIANTELKLCLNNSRDVRSIIEYIKNKKPEIDIHILGNTSIDVIKSVRHLCTSCDSTSWIRSVKYNDLKGVCQMEDLDKDKVRSKFGELSYAWCREYNNEQRTNTLTLMCNEYMYSYSRYFGNQDIKNI